MKVITYGRENKNVIVLLHGGGLSWWNFRSQAEMLCGEYRVELPVLDGHAGSDRDFSGIGTNAEELIDYIDRSFGGHVLALGGLSLGAQIAAETLSRRPDICRCALLESPALIPDRATAALLGPSISASYGLIRKPWFSRAQFRSLKMDPRFFDDYYRDSCAVSRENLIAFTRASQEYSLDPRIGETRARVLIAAGEKELPRILRSAKLLHERLPGSELRTLPGLYHGQFSLNRPEEYVSALRALIAGEAGAEP